MKYIKIKKEDETENKDVLINDIKQALTKDDSYYENLKNLSQEELLDLYSQTKVLEPKTEDDSVNKYTQINEFYDLVEVLTEILEKYTESSYPLEVLESLGKGDVEIVDNNSNLNLSNLDTAPIEDFLSLIKITKDFPYSFIIDSKFFLLPLRYKYQVIAICVFPNIIKDTEEVEEFSFDLDNISNDSIYR